jgi:hypothetical protein
MVQDEGVPSTVRLERRIDKLEDNFGARLDKMSSKMDDIADAQADFRAAAAGVNRAFEAIGKLEQRIVPLERDAPFVQLMTDGVRRVLRVIIWGALIVGATTLYPYMPWVSKQPLNVQIEPAPPKK